MSMDRNDTKGKTNENSAKQSNNGDDNSKKKEIVLLKQRIEELEEQNKRLLADYRNLEKRADAERREWILKANKQLLLNFLPVLDTLILVDKQSKGAQTLSLSIKQFLDILKTEGVEKIDVVGKQFDPKFMQCVDTVGGEEGKVLKEVQVGYRYRDGSLIRPSSVVVGKNKLEKEEEEKAKKELQKGDYM